MRTINRNAAGGFESIRCGEQDIRAAAIVFGPGASVEPIVTPSASANARKCGNISRAVLLTRRPFGDEDMNSGGGGVNLLKLPRVDGKDDDVQVVQLSHFSGTCPKDWCEWTLKLVS